MTITPEKTKRLIHAVGFMAGVVSCLDAVRDAPIVWPPGELWEGLRNVQRVEFAAGVALVAVSIVLTIARSRSA